MSTETDGPSERVPPTPQTARGWLGIWALWLLLTIVGQGVGGIAVGLFSPLFWQIGDRIIWLEGVLALTSQPSPEGKAIVSVFGIFVFYLGVSAGQWIILRRWARPASWWILALGLGHMVGYAIAVIFGLYTYAKIFGLIGGGVSQWLVLRRWSDRALWWPIASLALALLSVAYRWYGHSEVFSAVWIWFIYGAVTGAAIVAVFVHGVRAQRGVVNGGAPVQPRGRAIRYLSRLPLVIVFGLLLMGSVTKLSAAARLVGFLSGPCVDVEPVLDMPSPHGRYIARSASSDCVDDVGVFDVPETRVSLTTMGAFRPHKPEVVFTYSGSPDGLVITWNDEKSLSIQHSCTTLRTRMFAWQDVLITYKGVEQLGVGFCGDYYLEVPPPTDRERKLLTAIEAAIADAPESIVRVDDERVILTAAEAESLGRQWVGDGYISREAGFGRTWLIARQTRDGTNRQYLGPQIRRYRLPGAGGAGLQVTFRVVDSKRMGLGDPEAQRSVYVETSRR